MTDPRRLPTGSDRFLAQPASASAFASADPQVELHESEFFWTGPEPDRSMGRPIPRPRIPDRCAGILAALADDNRRPPPKLSTSTSPPSAARMIPAAAAAAARERRDFSRSAPVNVPAGPRRAGRDRTDRRDDDDGDEEWAPPHEIVDRAAGRGSPMRTSSVLEGVGRTLKGRDLRRVRNAVWRRTGFVD